MMGSHVKILVAGIKLDMHIKGNNESENTKTVLAAFEEHDGHKVPWPKYNRDGNAGWYWVMVDETTPFYVMAGTANKKEAKDMLEKISTDLKPSFYKLEVPEVYLVEVVE